MVSFHLILLVVCLSVYVSVCDVDIVAECLYGSSWFCCKGYCSGQLLLLGIRWGLELPTETKTFLEVLWVQCCT